MKLSAHFDSSEFKCKDGSYKAPDPKLIQILEAIREKAGKPLKINSGYRSPAYNKKVGGSPNSQHLLSKAADIVIAGMTPSEVAKIAESCGATGIGVYKTFTHVDVRPSKARWNG